MLEGIIALVIIGTVGYYMWQKSKKPAESAAEPEAPYKVETPAAGPTKCGCGRSPTGFCVGLHKLSESEWAKHDANPNKKIAPVLTATGNDVAKPKSKKAPAEKKPKVAKPKAEGKPKAVAKKTKTSEPK